MVYSIDIADICLTFNISTISELDGAISSIAPSMCEYYFNNLITCYGDKNCYLNRSQIQKTIHIGDYSLYLDYSDNIFIEKQENVDEYIAQSLW